MTGVAGELEDTGRGGEVVWKKLSEVTWGCSEGAMACMHDGGA